MGVYLGSHSERVLGLGRSAMAQKKGAIVEVSLSCFRIESHRGSIMLLCLRGLAQLPVDINQMCVGFRKLWVDLQRSFESIGRILESSSASDLAPTLR